MCDWVLIECFECDGSGGVEIQLDYDPEYGPTIGEQLCSACDGYGTVFVEAEPITMEDLDIMAGVEAA